MSEPEGTDKPRHSKTAEFGRWLIVIALIAITAAGINTFLGRIQHQDWMFLIPVWICISLGEGWVQFSKTTSRLTWLLAGILTGISLSFPSYFDTFSIKGLFVLMVPAGFEWLAARRERSRAWIWLIVTPALYGSAAFLSDRTMEIVPKVMNRLTSFLGISLPTSGDYATLATLFAVLLLTRAMAGSFIASRKSEPT